MLRAPLPTTLNYYLAIHSNHSFWIVQKDQASLSAVRPTTPRRPVQTGRLRRAAGLGYRRVEEVGPDSGRRVHPEQQNENRRHKRAADYSGQSDEHADDEA